MSEIPEDVMDRARELAHSIRGKRYFEAAETAAAKALISERNRALEAAAALSAQPVQPVVKMRTGDHVLHRPSQETWVVAWADYETGYMAPCGWPTCQARIDDCDIVKDATDEESAQIVAALAISGRTDAHKATQIADRSVSATPPASAGPAVKACPVGSEELVEQAWCELVNKDDRTSPEEYPDMALITFDELREIIVRFSTLAQQAPGKPKEPSAGVSEAMVEAAYDKLREFLSLHPSKIQVRAALQAALEPRP